MASERSCSATMSDRRVMSQYHSFVIILGGVGAAWPTLDTGALCWCWCSLWLYGAQN